MLLEFTGPGDFVFLTWLPDEPMDHLESDISRAYEKISHHLESQGAVAVQERIFCDIRAAKTITAGRSKALTSDSAIRVPPTLIQGSPTRGGMVAGIHVIAVRPSGPDPVKTISWNDQACGMRVSGADADYIGLSDIGRLLNPDDHPTPGLETRDALLLTSQLLETQDWAFTDVCRTWFYLDDILAWYDDFNAARNQVFTDFGLLNGSQTGCIPASTGIRGRNPRGHRCTLDLLAVRPQLGQQLSIELLHNPLQNEAPEYGSAFSRGLTLATNRCRTLFVSGTASIDEGGITVHPGDFDSQTRRTLDNIESLLASRGAVMDDICQATAFVKRREDSRRLDAILSSRGLEKLPLVCTVDDICRDDLLVEIDAAAMIPQRPPNDV